MLTTMVSDLVADQPMRKMQIHQYHLVGQGRRITSLDPIAGTWMIVCSPDRCLPKWKTRGSDGCEGVMCREKVTGERVLLETSTPLGKREEGGGGAEI